MPQLSRRISTLNDGGSDGWEVFQRARAMMAAGEDVTELTIGEHDTRTDPAILDAMHRSATGGHTGYAALSGTSALRDEIAARVTARTGVPTRRGNVLVVPGGQAALFAAHMALLDPGDAALFVDPHYATYPGTIRAASGQPVPVRTDPARAFLPTAGEIASEAARTGARTLLINTPNNPTGMVYPAETLAEIAQVCRAQDLWLISDEVYDTQVWQGTHASPRALPGMAGRTLVIGSMSKSHAMTGARCGWIVAPEEVIARTAEHAMVTTYGVPGFVQDASLFALRQGTPLEEKIAAPFRRRRSRVLAILSRQDTITALPSQATMYLMLDIRRTGLSGRAFAEALLDAHRIAVMPGESFGRSAAGHVRVALTVDDDRLAAAIRTLCTFATEHAHAA